MLFIRNLHLSLDQEQHIWVKHRVARYEVEEICDRPTVHRNGKEGSVEVYGQTEAGRYVIVILYEHGEGNYHVATARDMEIRERRYYQERRR